MKWVSLECCALQGNGNSLFVRPLRGRTGNNTPGRAPGLVEAAAQDCFLVPLTAHAASRGHIFWPPRCRSRPPASDFRKFPNPHGEGPLVERRHGQARTAAPSLGPYVPYSALAGLRRDIRGMRWHIVPLRIGYRPPPPAPARGAAGYGPPMLRGCGPPPMASPLRRGPPAPGSVGLGLSATAAARRSAAAPAPRSPRYAPSGDGSDGSGTRSWGSPLGCSVWTWRSALRATAGSLPALPRRNLGGSPQDGPARALPSLVPRSVGRLGGLTGSAPPAWGLSRSPEGTAL